MFTQMTGFTKIAGPEDYETTDDSCDSAEQYEDRVDEALTGVMDPPAEDE